MTYLIVGASSGLGRELASSFAKQKKDLIIVSRDERDLTAIKSDLEAKYKVKVNFIALDFSSIEEIDEKLLSKEELLTGLQGALFPVGMMFEEDNLNLNAKNMQKLVLSNFISISYTIQNVKKFLQERKNTSLIGFGSVSGLIGRGVNTFYAASKRGLESYFESLGLDKDYRKINIQFYILGYLDTNLSFGKNLKLPKGSVEKLSKIVYKNKNINFKVFLPIILDFDKFNYQGYSFSYNSFIC